MHAQHPLGKKNADIVHSPTTLQIGLGDTCTSSIVPWTRAQHLHRARKVRTSIVPPPLRSTLVMWNLVHHPMVAHSASSIGREKCGRRPSSHHLSDRLGNMWTSSIVPWARPASPIGQCPFCKSGQHWPSFNPLGLPQCPVIVGRSQAVQALLRVLALTG